MITMLLLRKKCAQNKHCRHWALMFEITLYIILLIDCVQQIARYFRKEFVQFGPNTSYAQEFIKTIIKITHFHVLTKFTFFCIYLHQLRTYHGMGLVKTANKGYWRNFCVFVYFNCHLESYYLPFLGRGMCMVLK